MFGLGRIELALIGAVVAVALTSGGLWWVYHRGETAGSSSVTSAVQEKTIKAGETARIQREKADADVRSVPYRERVDGLR